MSNHKFKEIPPVLGFKDLVNVVLSKTQRCTPTEVHPQFKITRIRSFYIRKVKFAQTTFNERLTSILDGFPRVDDVHPFYADLFNVLYDRDHFKLALGQLSSVRQVIDNVSKDMVKMLKYADSPYKCKLLKRAALGRMCTACKKLGGSLSYLEEVRQHLARLPSISPTTKTLLLTGYPNVGKSSFMNILTNANVDVQPYAFTTKSLFVGHMDFLYSPWQVIDTPGILDHPLEERNTIEMTAITALAHLHACILFFVDISEHCGFTIPQQIALFHSIKPLFKGKPLLMLVNKTDLVTFDKLSPEERQLFSDIEADESFPCTIMATSCANKSGIDAATAKACSLLMDKRVTQKLGSGASKVETLKGRIQVVTAPNIVTRPVCIPSAVMEQRAVAAANMKPQMPTDGGGKKKQTRQQKHLAGESDDEDASAEAGELLEKDLMQDGGGAGVYVVDVRKHAILADEAWRYDVPPEIMDGHNVADFIDPDIDRKLRELEEEEELLLAAFEQGRDVAAEDKWDETQAQMTDMYSVMEQVKLENRMKKSRNHSAPTGARARSIERIGKKRVREQSRDVEEDIKTPRRRGRGGEEVEEEDGGRLRSVTPNRVELGLQAEADRVLAEKQKRKKQRKMQKDARKGEGDHHVPTLMPKHLFSGKRPKGTADHR